MLTRVSLKATRMSPCGLDESWMSYMPNEGKIRMIQVKGRTVQFEELVSLPCCALQHSIYRRLCELASYADTTDQQRWDRW